MSAPAPSDLSILLVDDQPFFLSFHGTMFSSKGYRVQTAASAEEALTLARQAPPDLFILDVEMPGMNGIDLCQRIKAEPTLRERPVLILTATADPKLNERAFRAGAAATVVKYAGAERILNIAGVLLRGGTVVEGQGM